jgi:hypothetical protein
MKRGILLILMLLLLFDLADGTLGKAQFFPTHSNAKISPTTAPHHGSVKVDFFDASSSPDCPDVFATIQSEPARQTGQLALTIITSCNKGSAGGIPR